MRIKIKSRYQVDYQTAGAACVDLVASLDESIIILPGEVKLIPTGLYLEIPINIRAEVLSRSGLAHARQLIVLNAPGIIDSDYRGEVKVLLMNLGILGTLISPRQRIAQLGFTEIIRPTFERVEELSKTERGDGGFGSTDNEK